MGEGGPRFQGQPHGRGGDHGQRTQDIGHRALRCLHGHLGGPGAQGRGQVQIRREGRPEGRGERPRPHRQGPRRDGSRRSGVHRPHHDRARRHREQVRARRECHGGGIPRSRPRRRHGRGCGDLRAHREGPRHPSGSDAQHHQRRQARRGEPEDPGMHDHPRRGEVLLRLPSHVFRGLHEPQGHPEVQVRGRSHQHRRRRRIRSSRGHRRRGAHHHHGRGLRCGIHPREGRVPRN